MCDEIKNKNKHIKEFEEAIKKVFGEEFLKDVNENEEYKIIKESNEFNKENFGDCDEARKLMMYIRKEMISKELAPSGVDISKLGSDEHHKEVVLEGMKKSKRFLDLFKNVYDCDKDKKELKYCVDGWNYYNDCKDYSDDEIANMWIKKNNYKHYYYNELDHYLTYLVSKIVTGKDSKYSDKVGGWIDWGLELIRSEIMHMKSVIEIEQEVAPISEDKNMDLCENNL